LIDDYQHISPFVEAVEAKDLPFKQFRFITDHNVPDSVGNVLIDLGHDVVRLREVMAVDTTDPIVARAAIEDQRVLVSWDRDFNQQRFMAPRFARLSRLSMSGPEMDGAQRLLSIFGLVSFALNRAGNNPITIRVGSGKVQIHV
jgi:hypothetical protein